MQLSHSFTPLLVSLAAVTTGLACAHAQDAPAGATALLGAVPQVAAAPLLGTLRKEHPRLLATASDWDAIKTRAANDPTIKAEVDKVRANGTKMLDQEPSKYEIPDGLRLLATSRRVRDRVLTLGFLYRVDGDRKYADRAWRELDAAAHFPDWNNKRHFLDTAEMTNAFAIGYDWLYDAWTPEQRQTLREAIIEKGLTPGVQAYGGAAFGWWVKVNHNWNQVCNGGLVSGALAIGDEVPDVAQAILDGALKSIPRAMKEFAPDGAWAEGPGYWDYATSYNVMMIACLQSALGTDFKLAQTPGFDQTGGFPISLTGPFERTFNYADGGDHAVDAPQLFWMARRFDQPGYASFQQAHALQSPSALDIVYQIAGPGANEANATAKALPLDKYFRGPEVVSMRSAWNDPNAIFLAFKAGDNKANHSHLDLGSFVLDALGQRWVVDLGAEDYNVPGYFGAQRWTYYRTRAEGHNVPVLNPGVGPDQDPKAAARMTRTGFTPQRAFAITDLTAAYAANATKVERGIALLDRRQVVVQDEIKSDKAADTWWFLHTTADAQLGADNKTATLTLKNAHLSARLLSPPDATFTLMDAAPLPTSPHPDKQNDNKGTRKLAIHLPNMTDARIVVAMTPYREGEAAPTQWPDVKPLAEW